MFLSSSQECVCGRSFDNARAFTRHKKTCQKGRKRLANALRQARELYYSKRHHVEGNHSDGRHQQFSILDSLKQQVVVMVSGCWYKYDFPVRARNSNSKQGRHIRVKWSRSTCYPFSLCNIIWHEVRPNRTCYHCLFGKVGVPTVDSLNGFGICFLNLLCHYLHKM